VAFWFPAAAVFLCATFALFTMPEALAYFDFSQHCHIFCMQDGEGEKKAGTSRVRENGEVSGIAFLVPVANFGAAMEKDEDEESELFVGDCVRHMAALLQCAMVLQAVSGCCQPKHRNRSSSKELQAAWPK
jgi:hypothetical protein